MAVELTLEVLEDPESAAYRASEHFAERARAAVAARARFTAALSGGRTPWRMFELLGGMDVPWERTDLYQADERVAPDGDPDRSMTHLARSLPPAGFACVHPMPVDGGDIEEAAVRYAQILPDPLDLIHLGLGPDGHTASLVPDDAVLEVANRTVATTGPYQGRRRMTLTLPALNAAREILWLVTGDDKPQALGKLIARDASIPAARVQTQRQTIFADRTAAAGLA